MKDYEVLLAYELNAAGDIIKLNDRQAKYLLMLGHIKLAEVVKSKKEDK